jgi:hypothetical protein
MRIPPVSQAQSGLVLFVKVFWFFFAKKNYFFAYVPQKVWRTTSSGWGGFL